MNEVIKSNGKKYWSKPLITGVQVYSGNHFDLFIPVGHNQFIVEEYSDYDMEKDWGKNEVEYTYEEVIKRFEPTGSELVAIDRIGKKAKDETKCFFIYGVKWDVDDVTKCKTNQGYPLNEWINFTLELDDLNGSEDDNDLVEILIDQVSDRLGFDHNGFNYKEIPVHIQDKDLDKLFSQKKITVKQVEKLFSKN